MWLHGEVRSPPLGRAARIEAGVLLRRVQEGEIPGLPHGRPMPAIGPRCHELRIQDRGVAWRIVYRIDPDAVIVLDVFAKKSAATPRHVLEACRRRLRAYLSASGGRPGDA